MSKYDIEQYIGMEEAEKITGVKKAYINRLCNSGRLDGAAKIGRNWIIPRPVAEEFRRRKDIRDGLKGKIELT